MSGIKPKARDSETDLRKQTGSTATSDTKKSEHGIVLDGQAQEQPKDKKRAQQSDQRDGKR